MRFFASLCCLVACTTLAGSLAKAGETKMRSLSDLPERHVAIAQTDGDYISFPDVCVTRGGRLICVYRVADKHVATRSRLEVKTSDDRGCTWSAPYVLAERGHCPRLAVLENGEVLLISDGTPLGTAVYRSLDEGRTWSKPTAAGLKHAIPDRPLRIGKSSLLTTGHRHVGSAKSPLLGQATTSQVLYRSDDMGAKWREWAVLACNPNLVLCEASMFKMPDESLRVYLRENSGVQEPTYVMSSFDEGTSWTPPEASPTIGHRPCAGLLQSGRVLVTYRHVGPNGGNRAWLGDADEDRFFAPVAFDLGTGAKLTSDGLVIENASGDDNAVMYSLRPMTDPRSASARLDMDLAVLRNEGQHCGVHLGCLWRIFPDRIEPQISGAEPVPISASEPHQVSIRYDKGVVSLAVDGEDRLSVDLAQKGVRLDRARRPIYLGNLPKTFPWCGPFRYEKNGGKSVWKSIRLRIDEPRFRRYEWSWQPADGLPNQYEVDHVLELQNDRNSSPGDFGYSGWTQFADGEIFCVAHYRGEASSSHVTGTWLKESDFAD